MARIRQLQDREAEAEEKMQEQLERYKLCKQSLDTASQQLREQEDGLATASEVSTGLYAGPEVCFLPLSHFPREKNK